MENSITQDQYDDAIMRGDVAMTALRAVRGSAQQGQVRLLTVVERLQKLNMPMETPRRETHHWQNIDGRVGHH